MFLYGMLSVYTAASEVGSLSAIRFCSPIWIFALNKFEYSSFHRRYLWVVDRFLPTLPRLGGVHLFRTFMNCRDISLTLACLFTSCRFSELTSTTNGAMNLGLSMKTSKKSTHELRGVYDLLYGVENQGLQGCRYTIFGTSLPYDKRLLPQPVQCFFDLYRNAGHHAAYEELLTHLGYVGGGFNVRQSVF